MRFVICSTYESHWHNNLFVRDLETKFVRELSEYFSIRNVNYKQGYCYSISIRNISDLIRIREITGKEIILCDEKIGSMHILEIYNDWRE